MGWQAIVQTIAPTIATGLGGPLAGIVAKIVAGALFPDDPQKQAEAKPSTIANYIEQVSSPEDVAKLKQAEQDLKKFEAENNLRFAELDEKSLENARAMRIAAMASGNQTADRLSWAVLGSFAVVALFILVGCGFVLAGTVKYDANNGQVWIAISGLIGSILGYFSANAQQVVSFYFGSSSGAAAKTDQLANQTSAVVTALATSAQTSRLGPAGAGPGAGAATAPTVVKTNADGGVTVAQGEPATSEVLQVGHDGGKPVALNAPVVVEARWDACITAILKSEGGYVDDPADHGGATNMGITQATLDAWRKREGTDTSVTKDDVRNLTATEAKAIYRAHYWNVLRCDALRPGVDLCLLDIGVLSGPARAAKMLQRIVGFTGADVDSIMGPQTISAANAMNGPELIDALARARQDFYNTIVARDPTQQRFLQGWTNRVEAVKGRALEMARTWS